MTVQGAGNGGADWREDPSADERWNAGLDFAMEQLCQFMGVDPEEVTWDAATETVDGDVRAVMGNILRAKLGEDWGPSSTPQPTTAGYESLPFLCPCCGARGTTDGKASTVSSTNDGSD